MQYKISYSESDNILFIETEGVVDIASEERLRKEIIEWKNDFGFLNYLLDFRNIKVVKLGTADIFNLRRKYMKQKLSHDVKIALLVKNIKEEDVVFYENVCKNIGYNTKIFYDYEETLAWLNNK